MAETRRGVTRQRRIVGLFVFLLVSAALVSLKVGRFQVYWVTSGSMEPTIQVGDYLLVNGTVPVTPRRGDIVVVINPTDTKDSLCKRVVGQPFDRIDFRQGYLFVNDLQDSLSTHPYEEFVGEPYNRRWSLGADEYFVLGDNRDESFDSAVFGPVTSESLLGIVRFIYWPANRMGWF